MSLMDRCIASVAASLSNGKACLDYPESRLLTESSEAGDDNILSDVVYADGEFGIRLLSCLFHPTGVLAHKTSCHSSEILQMEGQDGGINQETKVGGISVVV